MLHNEIVQLLQQLVEYCITNIDRSKCEDALRSIIDRFYYYIIPSLNQGLFRGHIEKLALLLNEKMKKIEFLYEG